MEPVNTGVEGPDHYAENVEIFAIEINEQASLRQRRSLKPITIPGYRGALLLKYDPRSEKSDFQSRAAVITKHKDPNIKKICIVADGMGGYRNGAEAAEVICKCGGILGSVPAVNADVVRHMQFMASSYLKSKFQHQEQSARQGITYGVAYLVAVLNHNGTVTTYHVGDCEARLFDRNSGNVIQRTRSPHRTVSFLTSKTNPTITETRFEYRKESVIIITDDGWCKHVPDDVFGSPQEVTIFRQIQTSKDGLILMESQIKEHQLYLRSNQMGPGQYDDVAAFFVSLNT